ncbi:PAS domain-containing protein [Xanthomonas sp. NCPPB 2654]|uniref:PAS domain-containing protein n=1 Tax=unclassified Xanthomonas TaxID=2643310 RepID=UPI0021DF6DBC|nr:MULTISPECIES: PAS domain-containing protein [unclassified Xanthomonas]MDL5364792.1 PAS domain-containing protein [Xanthomonas sp. NCPPB 2654]UYC18820.1 PAS domain-containing protein [Xanthomonas sp. CFBP 8443]
MLCATDWSGHELGPLQEWPQSLRSALSLCLNSRFPMVIRWGQRMINLYNDAYIPILGMRHPFAFGRASAEVWPDVWPTVGLQAERVLATGEPTWNAHVPFVLTRNGYDEEAYFTFSYSPIFDDHGGIGGVLCVCTEDTAQIRLERERDALLKALDAQRTQMADAFEQSPAALAILRGPDYVVESVNRRYQQLVGPREVVGKPLAEAIPEILQQGFIDLLDNVRASGQPFTGESMTFNLRRTPHEAVSETTLECVYQPMRDAEGNVTGVLVHGIDRTEQARAQAHDSFLLMLEDALQNLDSAEAICETGAALLGQHLQANRCAYAIVDADEDAFDVRADYVDGTAHLTGRSRFSDFGSDLLECVRENRPWVVQDTEAHSPPLRFDDPGYRRMGMRAILTAPLHKAGRLVAAIGVHQVQPRVWTSAEIELVRLVAARCWESMERAGAQSDLARSEARLRELADAMPQIVFTATPEGDVDYFNRRWYEYTGLPPGDRGHDSWRTVHTEEGLAQVTQAWPEAIRSGQPYELEYPLRRHDGSYRWHLGRALPIRDGDGRIVRWIGTNTDIHDRRVVEQRLQESELRFRNLCDNAPVLIWMANADGDCEYVSRQWFLFTGQTEQEAMGSGWMEKIHADDVAAVGHALTRAAADRRAFTIEYRLRRHDGEYRWCVDTATPRFSAAGQFLGFIGSLLDIAERKRIENATAAERAALEMITTGKPLNAVLEAIARGIEAQSDVGLRCTIMLVDEHRQCLLEGAAPSMPAVFRKTVQRLPIGEHSGSCGRAAFLRRQVLCSDVRVDANWQQYLVMAAEADIVACCSTPILASDGQVLGVVALYYPFVHYPTAHEQDLARSASHLAGIIIERRETDLRLQQLLAAEQSARGEAERASRMKDEFLATLSHELRTPLNAILGWSRLMQGAAVRETDLTRGLEVIERSAHAQAQIIDDLLDMSAILSGKVRLEPAELDLCALAGEAIDTARPGAESKGIDIVLTPCSDSATLPYLGDAVRLQQVLTNLIGNAIKFTPSGGKVTVTLDHSATHLRISVSDSGAGIDPLFLPHVFDRFRQADASSTRSAGGLGLGLGLAIAKQLTEMHHGQLSVSSEGVGLGATFTLLLPRNDLPGLDPARRSDSAALAAAAMQRGRIRLNGLRVLVVDDDMDSRGITQRFLQQVGAVVDAAVSADDAESLLRERPYDLLVSDVGMPRRDGHSLIRSVRARGAGAASRIPAIALTAYVRGEDRSLALEAGFNAHLGKPVDPAKLIALAASLTQPQIAAQQDPNAQTEPA